MIRETKIGRNNEYGRQMKEIRIPTETYNDINDEIEKKKKALNWKNMNKKEKKRIYVIREAMMIKERLEMIEESIDKERMKKVMSNLAKIEEEEEEELYRLIHDDKYTRHFFAKIDKKKERRYSRTEKK